VDQDRVQVGAGGDGDLAVLRQQLRDTRAERMRLQRALANRVGVEAAIRSTERDIDTRSSSQVEDARAIVEQLTSDLLGVWAELDWHRMVTARLEHAGVALDALPHSAEHAAELVAEAQTRRRIAIEFAESDVPLRVPPAVAPVLPDHPRRDDRARMFREATERAERDAARRPRPGYRPSKDEHGTR
jgi:hypothetical protein